MPPRLHAIPGGYPQRRASSRLADEADAARAADRAARFAERDAAYRAALGLAVGDELPNALGNVSHRTPVKFRSESPHTRRTMAQVSWWD